MRLRLTALTLPVALLIAAPFASGGGLPASLKVAKEKDGPFSSEVRVGLQVGDTKSVWFRVKSTAEKPKQFGFNDHGTTSELDGYKVRWFKGDQNVSSSVQTEGLLLVLAPGDTRFFQAKVRHTGPGDPLCVMGQLFDESMQKDAFAGINAGCDS